jgi:transaldolase
VTESYFLAIKSRTPSRLWVNNPTLAEIELAGKQGAVGCTTNPAYAGSLLRRAPEEVLPVIRDSVAAAPDEKAAAHLVQKRLVARIAELYRPIFDHSHGLDGYVSIQGAPDEDHDDELILSRAIDARALAPNVAIKIPASEPGLYAFERLVADGTPTIVTEVFSVAQLIETCQTYLRVTKATGVRPAFFISPITGIFGDHLKTVARQQGISCSDAVIDWAGVALARACNHIVETRGYPVRLLFGGARLPVDFAGLIGSPTASTINYSTVVEILGNPPTVADTIHMPVDPKIVAELKLAFTDFARAMDNDGLSVHEFEHFGPVLHFRSSFLAGWKVLVDACLAANIAPQLTPR